MPKRFSRNPDSFYLKYGQIVYNHLLPDPTKGASMGSVFGEAKTINPNLKSAAALGQILTTYFAGFLRTEREGFRETRVYLQPKTDIANFADELSRMESEARNSEDNEISKSRGER